ncbi:MAG: TolB family protein [Nocardioides sp.]
MNRRGLLAGLATVVAGVAVATGGATAGAAEPPELGPIERVSVSLDGGEGDAWSYLGSSLSGDGRFVAFSSESSDLVEGDTNGVSDVFVRDRQSGTTERLSVGPGGSQSQGSSVSPRISDDGRYVAFLSDATDLDVDGPTPAGGIYVRDLLTSSTQRVFGSERGTIEDREISFSGNGRYVAFTTGARLVERDRNGARATDIYRVDVRTGKTRLVSLRRFRDRSGQRSWDPALSRSGRFVVFESSARLLRRDRNNLQDVYLRDMRRGSLRRMSVNSREVAADTGGSSPGISATGRYVVFSSAASNLGRKANDNGNVFVRDRRRGTTHRVSVDRRGRQGNSVSLVTPGRPVISRDGRYVVFWSAATNFTHGDDNEEPDVFLRDRATRTTTLVSATGDGTPGDHESVSGVLSADGSTIAFTSRARDLVPGDRLWRADVFVRHLG